MLKVGIIGCHGRMGRSIIEALIKTKEFTFVGGLIRKQKTFEKNSKDCVLESVSEQITENPHELFPKTQVMIDFTTPGSTLQTLEWACHYKVPLVIGTTALSKEDEKKIDEGGKQIAIFQSYNMSLAHTLMTIMVEKLASLLDDSYDIEIFEMHHAYKKDAPSGSALNLGHAAAKGRGIPLKLPPDLTRSSPRQKGEIGFSVSRGGNVTGDHSVTFAGQGDLLTLSHRAFSSDIFVQGVLKATQWIARQKPGVYGMKDLVLAQSF